MRFCTAAPEVVAGRGVGRPLRADVARALRPLPHARGNMVRRPAADARALPFTRAMRALNGGSYALGGDMTGRVVAAGLFGSALAYLAGLILESVVRALARLALKTRAP